MEETLTPQTVSTPRQSRVGIVVAIILLLVSAGLWCSIYWGWQQHLQLAY